MHRSDKLYIQSRGLHMSGSKLWYTDHAYVYSCVFRLDTGEIPISECQALLISHFESLLYAK